MIKKILLPLLVLFSGWMACAPEPEDKPLSSEEVANIWLKHFYKDELKEAALYSTESTSDQLFELSKVIYTGKEMVTPEFNIVLDSFTKADRKQVWYYTFKDSVDTFQDSIVTVFDKASNTWLVDEVVYE